MSKQKGNKQRQPYTAIVCDQIIRYTLLTAACGLPIIILPWINDPGNLPKATFLKIATLIVLATWGFKLIYSKKIIWRKSALDLPILFFFLVILLSTAGSINRMASLFGGFFERQEGLFTWLCYILLFFTASNYLFDPKDSLRLLKVMVSAATAISIYAIFQHYGYDPFFFPEKTGLYKLQVQSTFGNPISLGGYLALILPLSSALFILQREFLKKVLWACSSGIIIFALVFTYSRGAWLGAFVGLVTLSVLIVKGTRPISLLVRSLASWLGKPANKPANKQTIQQAKLLITFILLLFLFISIAVIISEMHPSTSGLAAQRLLSVIRLETGGAGRFEIWQATIRSLTGRPIWGWGLETFEYVFPHYREKISAGFTGTTVDRPHNQLLYIAFFAGTVGLFAYLWVITTFLLSIFGASKFVNAQLLNRATSGRARLSNVNVSILLITILSACLGYLVQEQFSFSVVSIAPLFWILMGAAVAHEKTAHGPAIVQVSQAELSRMQTLPTTEQVSLPTIEYHFRLLPIWQHLLTILLALTTISLMWFSVNFVIADYHYWQGLLFSQSEITNKISKYERAVAYNPWNVKYRFDLGDAYNSLALTRNDAFWAEQSLQVYKKGLAIRSREHMFYFGLGNTYYVLAILQKEPDYTLAQEAYSKSIKLEPFFADAYTWLGKIYMNEGRYKKAMLVLQRSLALDPGRPRTLEFLGQIYEAEGDVKKAIIYFKKVLTIDPYYQPARDELIKLTAEE